MGSGTPKLVLELVPWLKARKTYLDLVVAESQKARDFAARRVDDALWAEGEAALGLSACELVHVVEVRRGGDYLVVPDVAIALASDKE